MVGISSDLRDEKARRRKKKIKEDEEQCSWLKCCHRCQEIYNSDTQTPDGTPLPPVPSRGGIFTLTHDNSLTALSNYHANYCNQYWSYGFDAPIYHVSTAFYVMPFNSIKYVHACYFFHKVFVLNFLRSSQVTVKFQGPFFSLCWTVMFPITNGFMNIRQVL